MRKFIYLLSFLVLSCSNNTVKENTKPISSAFVVSSNVNQEKSIPVESLPEQKEEPCPPDMIHVKGNYCPKVELKCKVWHPTDPHIGPFAKFRRCLEFHPVTCLKEKVPMEFCIDKDEFATNWEGKPVENINWNEAENIAHANDRRLCSREEWTFACSGEEMLPYSTGHKRPFDDCNIDVKEHGKPVVCGKEVCDHRADIKDYPKCLSPFGVHNMIGNVDEMVLVPRYHHSKIPTLTMTSALQSGHFIGYRNNCYAMTTDHSNNFSQKYVQGFRECRDIRK